MFTKNDYFESTNGKGTNIWLIPNSQKNEMEPIILVLNEEGDACLDRLPFEGRSSGMFWRAESVLNTGSSAI